MHDLHAESAVAVETSGESTNRKAESNEQLLNQIIVRISNISQTTIDKTPQTPLYCPLRLLRCSLIMNMRRA